MNMSQELENLLLWLVALLEQQRVHAAGRHAQMSRMLLCSAHATAGPTAQPSCLQHCIKVKVLD